MDPRVCGGGTDFDGAAPSKSPSAPRLRVWTERRGSRAACGLKLFVEVHPALAPDLPTCVPGALNREPAEAGCVSCLGDARSCEADIAATQPVFLAFRSAAKRTLPPADV